MVSHLGEHSTGVQEQNKSYLPIVLHLEGRSRGVPREYNTQVHMVWHLGTHSMVARREAGEDPGRGVSSLVYADPPQNKVWVGFWGVGVDIRYLRGHTKEWESISPN